MTRAQSHAGGRAAAAQLLLLAPLLLGAASAARLGAAQAPAAAAAPAAIGAAPKPPPGAAAVTAAAAAAPAAAAPAVPAAPGAASPKVFHIGLIVPLSGPKANTGRAVQAAAEMAVRDLAASKLPGVKVELMAEDTKCGDVGALWGGRKLAKAHVEAMIGEVCSAASLGALGVINKFQIPLISPASTSPALSIKDDYFYRTVPADRYQGQFAARKMIQAGAKAVVIASTSDSYGQELSYNFIAAFTRDGGKAFDVEVPAGTAGDKNASAVLQSVRDNGADGVFIATNDLDWAADIIRLIRTAQPPLNVTIFGGDSIMDPTLVQKLGNKALAKGIRGSEVSFGTPKFQKAFADYTKGQNISYTPKAAHAYDAAWALMEAYARAPEKMGSDILDALKDLKFEGKSGPIAFDEYGDLKYDGKNRLYTVTQFNDKGDIVPVSEPAKPAAAKPGAAKPGAAKPAVAKPAATKPAAAKAAAARPVASAAAQAAAAPAGP